MTLSADDPRPVSEQMAAVLRDEIRSGVLGPNGQIPSLRDLTERFGVATATAQKVVDSLRREGLIYTSPGRGSFVRDPLPDSEPEEQHSPEYLAVTQQLDNISATVKQLADRITELETGLRNLRK